MQRNCNYPVLIFQREYLFQATERFEAIYPTLKEEALAGSAGSKAMKQVSQQILTLAVRAAGEGNFELELTHLLISYASVFLVLQFHF